MAILILALLAAAAAVVAIAIHYAGRGNTSQSGPTQSTSLVVLPLENLSGDKGQDYFADGMTDELIANLAKIRSLRVISRSTAMAYKGTRKPLSEIARELHVDAVIEGTVLREGSRIRITAELVQVSTDHHLWAETYESQIGDVLALQNRVSSAIVNEIRINLTPEDRARLAKNPAIAPEAYANYLKGRFYWNKRSDENLMKAIGYFEQATHQDADYALAYAGLSDCYAIIGATIFGTMRWMKLPRRLGTQRPPIPHLTKPHSHLNSTTLDWSGAKKDFNVPFNSTPATPLLPAVFPLSDGDGAFSGRL